MKNVRYWLHMYKLTTDGNYIKTFAGHFRNRDEKEKQKIKKTKTTKMAIAKLVALHANAISISSQKSINAGYFGSLKMKFRNTIIGARKHGISRKV